MSTLDHEQDESKDSRSELIDRPSRMSQDNIDETASSSNVNIGDVAGGIRDSQIAGRDIRNIFQIIQTLPTPLLVLIGIAIPLLVILSIINLPPLTRNLFPTPTPMMELMAGDFNIALAQFDVTGEGEGLEEAKVLAQNFANS